MMQDERKAQRAIAARFRTRRLTISDSFHVRELREFKPGSSPNITRLSILTWFPNLLVLVRDAQRSCRIGWKAGPVSS
jgi:hypothetical protein